MPIEQPSFVDGVKAIVSVKHDTVRRRVALAAEKEGLFLGMHREKDLADLWYLTRKKNYRLEATRQTMHDLAQRFDVLKDHECMEGY